LGSLNYVADFYQNLRKQCKALFDRLQTNPPPWTDVHTSIVQDIKKYVKTLPCLGIPTINSFKIVETDASNIGFGGILKQRISPGSPEQIVRFHSGVWTKAQINYSTIKKEILSIVLCINKFHTDLINKKFLIGIDCKSAKYVLEKDVENIASKHIFARWQSILNIFDLKLNILKEAKTPSLTSLSMNFCRIKMASKNAKKATSTSSKIPPNKLPEIKPELVTPSQLVRYNPQQASSQNNPSSSRMVSLGKPVQRSSSFAQTLTESYDPFNKKIVPTIPAAPIKHRNNKKAVSPHHLLFAEKLFQIEFEHRRIENPLHLIKSYFPPYPTDGIQQYYYPSVPYKTINYYQNILQQEGSVEIKSIYGKTPETKN
jgi:hypothetical protein